MWRRPYHASTGGTTRMYHQHLLNKDIFLFFFNYWVEMLPPPPPRASQAAPEPLRFTAHRTHWASSPPRRAAARRGHAPGEELGRGTGAGMRLFPTLSLRRAAWPLHQGSRLSVRPPSMDRTIRVGIWERCTGRSGKQGEQKLGKKNSAYGFWDRRMIRG